MSDSSQAIRITKEEATSEHVDDLLKRQMSLRGDPGVTRDRRKKWYFQNWLVLMLAGAVGAVVAWAIIEPFFDDELYVQGVVASWDGADTLPERLTQGNTKLELKVSVTGSFVLNGQKLFVVENTREILPGGGTRLLEPGVIRNGANLGFYVQYHPGLKGDLAFVGFVERDPKPLAPDRARMTLAQLQSRSSAAGLLLFPAVAGLIGLFIGAVDGIVCRQPRRALLCGGVGLVIGIVGGFLCGGVLANIIYAPLHELAMKQFSQSGAALGAFGFFLQTIGRSIAWCFAGMAMGLGQGIALRSQRLLLYGLLGGIIGGLFGGLFFDPIDLILLGPDKPSAHWSRLVGLAAIGLSVGGMIGVVELLARDAWLRMTQGPLTGKEFLMFKDVMSIGAAPSSDVYLFNDPQVAKHHAVLRAMGDECEIEARDAGAPVLLNNRPVQRGRLRHGDNITIGRTSFVFQRRNR